METIGEISDAINLIDVKRENLRRSFLQLQSQSQSPSSFNFTLNWTDIDSYFATLRCSLNHKFHLLQTLYPSSHSDATTLVLARPQLKYFCRNSDGLGLRRFIILAPDRLKILSELPDAYRCAPDAAAMVLDAMEGFYSPGPRIHKSCCVIMLEGLVHVKPVVRHDLMEKAMLVAVQWNRKRVSGGPAKDKEQNALGFLLLVGAYGLVDRFSVDELIDCFLIVARRRHTFDLCRQMIPANKISDLIQKLIHRDMLVVAVKFIIEFQKTDEFSPAALLEEKKLISERTIVELRKNVESQDTCNEVTLKEVNKLKSIIRCIDECHLESVYPKDNVVALINNLENQVGIRKQAVLKKLENDVGSRKREATGKKQQKAKLKRAGNEVGSRKRAAIGKKQPLLLPKPNKKPELNKFLEAALTGMQNVVPHQQPHMLPGQYRSSPATCAPTAPYAGPIGANIGYSGGSNPMPAAGSMFFSPQPHPPFEYQSSYYRQ